ncbi:Tetratricopeptide repeat protein [Sulfidibacter corallicola]|uniref:Tetratricopeptide repeat protein n=1 Tax=Sulfidibacter corallicola TaxID=2818388 RepID=A0A8A4TNK3_SULCO|nr:tetratricopeptide repeat protein [Sulfidibacter corallicola]QTD51130.1 tetratricopeptide repeat protein [Sulfidibacter corallicola]
MEVSTETVQTLMEIGYLAGGYGFFKESITIFEGLSAIRPDSEFPHIGFAMTKLNMKQPEEAVAILRDQALAKNPGNSLTKSFLGLALRQAGHAHECENVLNDVIERNDNETAVALAKSLLADD